MSLFKSVVQKKVIKTLWTQKKGPLSSRICLSGNKEVFNPGEDVRGEVHVSYNEDFHFCGLKLELEGFVVVKYRENKLVFQKKESILTESEYIVGAYGQKKIRSKPGTQATHTFFFTLPNSDIPASFKNPIGHIFYRIALFIDYGDNKLVQKACKQITLNSKLDLDPIDPCTSEPVEYERIDEKAKSRQISYNKRVTEPQLKFRFKLNHTGFLCGENVPFLLELENPKKRYHVTGMVAELVQKISYHGGKITKSTSTVLATTSKSVIEEEETDSYQEPQNETKWEGCLKVPSGLMPTQKGVIEFEYFLRISVNVAKNEIKSLTGEYPITVAITRDGVTAEHELASSHFYSENAVEASLREEDMDEDL